MGHDRLDARLHVELARVEHQGAGRLAQWCHRALGVCGGRPTFKYTRIEIAGTLDRLAAGESLEEIVAGYGALVPREAIEEAIGAK